MQVANKDNSSMERMEVASPLLDYNSIDDVKQSIKTKSGWWIKPTHKLMVDKKPLAKLMCQDVATM